MKRSSVLLIRRFAAILLTVLSVICLFWPAMISITDADDREAMEEKDEDYQDNRKSKEYKQSRKESLKFYKELYGKKDGAAYVDAMELYDSVALKGHKSFLHLRSLYTAASIMNRIVDENTEEPDYSYLTEEKIEELEEEQEEQDKEHTKITIYAIILNVLFFAMLASGAAAIVLSFLNKLKIASYVHAVLTVLGVVMVILVLVHLNHPYVEEGDDAIWGPGVGLFLMPIFSIGALVLYQRDKTFKGLFPKRGPKPAYAAADNGGNPFADNTAAARHTAPEVPDYSRDAYAAPAPTSYAAPEEPSGRNLWNHPAGRASDNNWGAPAPRPVSRPAEPARPAPAPAAEDWVCSQCEAVNPADAMFCSVCGAQKPAPRAAAGRPAFCHNCGEKLDPDARFCVSCGAKQF